eukprot:TRINITY_DN14519_c0_g1_i1.p1 TRINITY_DN14519_c0_g1~~TRINITY_DN14519_c0_g1_i1.p1  ORF type:complete len:381 (+),score=77.29 TRINITY_DN14519_c0_g1_i1:62-1204(+)
MPAVEPGCTVAVTGATGFIGSHIVHELLRRGFRVRAVVRNPADKDKNAHLIAAAEATGDAGKLEFVAGDLTQVGSYDTAFEGCQAVVHSAAVVEIGNVGHAEGMRTVVEPAVAGTRNVFRGIAKAGSVQRVVHTSSIAAIIDCSDALDTTLTPKDWNRYSAPANGDYYGYGKTQGELAAWAAAGQAPPGEPPKLEVGTAEPEQSGQGWDLAVINPGVVLGPCLTKAHTKASAVVVRQFLYGNEQPNYTTGVVDVRDVAAAHVAALVTPEAQGSRFICVQGPSLKICDLGPRTAALFPNLQIEAREPGAAKLWFGWLLSLLPVVGSRFMTEYNIRMLRNEFQYNAQQTTEVLGIRFRDLDETLRDTVESMTSSGFVKPRPK